MLFADLLFSFYFVSTVLARPPTCSLQTLIATPFDPLASTCSSPPEPYIVKPSPGKGLGAFASHTLETGSIILREAPVLRISPPEASQGSSYPIAEVTKLVRREFERLSPDAQNEVLSLTYHALPGEVEEAGGDKLGLILRTNAYNTGSQIGIFPKIARINHSCQPNAAYYWSEALGKRIIYATREIQQGEEIFVSYIPLLMSRAERQKRLDRYGFRCACSACSQSSRNQTLSDERRTDINQAFQAFAPQLTLEIPHHPVSLRKARRNAASSLKLAELVEAEGLADYYAMTYRVVAISHARVGDWERATVWANKGYEVRVMEDPRSAFTMEMYELTRRFIGEWERQLGNETRS